MQKKLAVLAMLLASAVVSYAQLGQGTIMLGGGIGFSAEKEQNPGADSRYTEFSLSPEVGFFVADNFAVGLAFGVRSENNEPARGTQTKVTSFGVGPFARYYIPTGNDKFSFFGDARFNASFYKSKPDNSDADKGGSFGASISPGFAFFPTENWSIDFSLSLLSFQSIDPDRDSDNDKQTEFNFGFDSFSPTIGIRYFISK